MEAGTELTAPQRAAVALNSEALTKEFTDLAEASKAIVAITNEASYTECHAARMRLVKARTTTVKRGKDVREDAQAFAKSVISEEKRLLAIIEPEEARLQGIQDAHDAIEEARKREAAEAEAKRVALAQACIAEINGKPMAMTGKPSAAIAVAIHDLRAMDVTPWAAEFLPIALDAKAKAVATLEQLHAGAVAQEQAAVAEAKRVADERAELAKLRAEQEERTRQEQARVAKEAQERAAEDAAARAKIESEQRESRERIAAEEAKARTEREEADRVAKALRDNEEAKLKARIEAQEAEDKRINAELAAEESRLQAERAEVAKAQQVEADRVAAEKRAEQDRLDGLKRAEEALHREQLDTDQIIVALAERIAGQKQYAGIEKAIAAYLAKKRKAAA